MKASLKEGVLRKGKLLPMKMQYTKEKVEKSLPMPKSFKGKIKMC